MLARSISRLSVASLLLVSSALGAEPVAQSTFQLRLNVPLVCTVSHQANIAPAGNGYQLGELHEFCNSPSGYQLTVNYAPGSMRGATISLGDERVILDGSGRAVISQAPGPRIRDRQIYAEPGPDGFDTDRIDFAVQTN